MTEFKLSQTEEKSLEEFKQKIKKKYKTCGFISYCFTPTGIGNVVKVRSSHDRKWVDITDLGNW